MTSPEVILHNGKIATVSPKQPEVRAVAIAGGRLVAVGSDGDVLKLRGPATPVIDLGGRRAIPGLNDSHLHLIRAASISTWNFAGTAFRVWPTPCACCGNRLCARRPRNGCA